MPTTTDLDRQGRLTWTLALVLLGIALPFIIVALIPYYHKGDLMAYTRWADCLEAFGPRTYLECGAYRPESLLDYPPLGLLLSGGAMLAIRQLLGTADPAVTDGAFRSYLVIYTAGVFLLLVRLAWLMRFRRPVLVGLVLLLMPWMVVGGMLWGQMDGLALMLCLSAFVSLLEAQRYAVRRTAWHAAVFLIVGALSLAAFILLKQTSAFALPFFAFLGSTTLLIFWRQLRVTGLLVASVALVVSGIVFRFIDTRFDLPPQFHDSALWYAWTVGGGARGEIIAGNGFNVWILLGRDMWSSPKTPFATLRFGLWSREITPYHTGIVLYLTLVGFLMATALAAAWPVLRRDAYTHWSGEQYAAVIAALCLFLGLTQLGFNVLLTGTHERYLFIGYPFLLLSTLWLASRRSISAGLAVFTFVAASLNGIFVFGAMHPIPGTLFVVYSNAFQASMHLILLVALLGTWLHLVQRPLRTAT